MMYTIINEPYVVPPWSCVGFIFCLDKCLIWLDLSKSKNVTSIQAKGVKGGITKVPWAFSGAEIYG